MNPTIYPEIDPMPYPMSFRDFARHYIDGAHACRVVHALLNQKGE